MTTNDLDPRALLSACRDATARPTRSQARRGPGRRLQYILCEDLFKIYKLEDLEVVALRGLDLKVRRGEMMAIVGASGSGKTTLLNILAGLDVPSAGRALVGGRNLLTMTPADIVTYRRKEVGFVWQQTVAQRAALPHGAAERRAADDPRRRRAGPGARPRARAAGARRPGAPPRFEAGPPLRRRAAARRDRRIAGQRPAAAAGRRAHR